MAGLRELNEAPADQARAILSRACGSSRWVDRMMARRPFASDAKLLFVARNEWFGLTEPDWLEAFAAHPRIGERQTGARWSADEQSGVGAAGAAVLEELDSLNRAYQEKHGFIFIVCATGKSAREMLELLGARLGTSRAEEIRTAAEEQAQIVELRLRKLVMA